MNDEIFIWLFVWIEHWLVFSCVHAVRDDLRLRNSIFDGFIIEKKFESIVQTISVFSFVIPNCEKTIIN